MARSEDNMFAYVNSCRELCNVAVVSDEFSRNYTIQRILESSSVLRPHMDTLSS